MSEQPIEPVNAFTQDYLETVRDRDEPWTAREAESSGRRAFRRGWRLHDFPRQGFRRGR